MARNYALSSGRSGVSGASCGNPAPAGHVDELAGMAAVARASGHRPAPALALLSMGHNSSMWNSSVLESTLKVWPEGARADFPAIPDMNPDRISRDKRGDGSDPSLRGVITEFSNKSRRRLQRTLGTMKLAVSAFTMALTLPGGDVSAFPHPFVTQAFGNLLRRLSVKKRFAGVSGFWKRELQKRGAIHYHLILYGLDDEGLRAEFHAWMVAQWCSVFTPYLSEEDAEHHRWFHARPDNMQAVRDFSGYFSKYIGKDGDGGGLPGRWWGSFNKQGLPVATRSDASVSAAGAVRLHRLARKAREKKMSEGKARADFRRLNSKHDGRFYVYSSIELWRLRSGYSHDSEGNWSRDSRGAAFILKCYRHQVKARAGVTLARPRFRGRVPKTAPIVLCGDWVPGFAVSALEWVNRSFGGVSVLKEMLLPKDLAPDPRKLVPPGRQFRLALPDSYETPPSPLVESRSARRIAGGSVRDALPKWERP